MHHLAPWLTLSTLQLRKIISAFRQKLTARALRMQLMQTAIYGDNAYADAQHQAAFVEVVAVYVFYSQFEQRHIFRFYGSLDRCLAKDRLENVSCHSRVDGSRL